MITLTKVRRSLLFAAAAAAVTIVTGAASKPRTPAEQLRAALAALPAMKECPTQCSWCPSADNHRNDAHENSTNQGTEHGCQFTEKGCGDHACSETLASLGVQDLDAMERMIRNVPASELKALASPAGHLRINLERGSIQVMGCTSQVVLNVALTAEQSADLAETR
jgi:hypothetical protein